MKTFKWRKWNRAIHRDLGYFFFAMSVIYGISGIAINHISDWNPNYDITNKQVDFGQPVNRNISKTEVIEFLKKYGEENNYKKHYFPNGSIFKIFLNGGSVLIDTNTGQGEIEKMVKATPFKLKIKTATF